MKNKIIQKKKTGKILPIFLLLILTISLLPTVNAALPTAPSNLAAESQGTSSIVLTWIQVNDAWGYYIYRSCSAYGPYSMISFTSDSMFFDTGLNEDTGYYYKISAMNENGEGELSEPVYACTESDIPGKPQAEATTISTSEIKVNWNPVSNAEGYYIYRSIDDVNFNIIGYVRNTEYTDTGLNADTTYYYKISAYGSGNEGMWSDSAWATTYKPIGAPRLTAEALNMTAIELRWNAVDNADGYIIYRSDTMMGTYSQIGETDQTEYDNTDLSYSTTYYYKIEAFNGSSTGLSNIVSATTMSPVEIPVLTAAAINTSSIHLTWNDINGAFDYDLYRSLMEDGVYEKIDTIDAAGSAEYTDTDLDPSTTYYYKVDAYNGYYKSELSDPATATTKTPETNGPDDTGNGGGSSTGGGKIATDNSKTKENTIPGFKTPVEEPAQIQAEEAPAGAGGFVLPLFLILAVLTTGVLYVRSRRRQLKQ